MTNGQTSRAWEAYDAYNRILRGWFVAFGIGVPATFLINTELSAYVATNSRAFSVFFVGVISQIFIAFLNKIIGWCTYYRNKFPEDHEASGKLQSLAFWLVRLKNAFIIDVLCDLTTILCFGWAIFTLMSAILEGKP